MTRAMGRVDHLSPSPFSLLLSPEPLILSTNSNTESKIFAYYTGPVDLEIVERERKPTFDRMHK